MQKSWKLFISLTIVVLIILLFSHACSADSYEVGSGSNEYYSWTLDSEGILNVKCKPGYYGTNTYFDLSTLDANTLKKVKTVIFDTSFLIIDQIYFQGGNCEATSISFSGCDNKSFKEFHINNFPCVRENNLNIPKSASYYEIYLSGVGIYSLSFIKDINVEFLYLAGCEDLKSAIITDQNKNLNKMTIYGSPELSKVSVHDSFKELSISGVPAQAEVSFPDSLEKLIWNYYSLSEITVPKSGYCHFGFGTMEKADFVSGRRNIDDSMFWGCKQLTNVYMPDSIISIGYDAFNDCESLKTIRFSNNLYSIDGSAFRHCKNLKTINLPDSVSSIESCAFRDTGLTSVKIPSGVTNLEYGVFMECSDLQSVYIPKSVTSIDYGTFTYCRSLKTVNYAGSQSDWGKIKITEYGEASSRCTMKDVFGNAKINFNVSNNKTGWIQNGSVWNYYDEAGCKVYGWYCIDDNWYYFDSAGAMLKNWQKIGDSYYYLGGNGVMRRGWQNIDKEWYYLGDSGVMRKGWQQISGTWYYFGESGAMRKGWQQISGSWYYFGDSGVMRKGWQQVSGTWYYFGESGVMKKGWQQISGSWYYFGDSGVMRKGWQQISGTWYYFGESGVMRVGWQQIGGKWYYFYTSGAMACNTTINGYKLNSSGVWVG